MIDYETYCRIKKMYENEGLKISQIAAELNMDQRTIKKWLKEEHFRARSISIRPKKIDPFKADILRLLESHPYTAMQIYQRLLEMGFNGSYNTVKRFVRKVRPRRVQPFLKLAFAPGECAQVDWGSYGTVRVGEMNRRLSFFVMVMCHSRMMYVEFTVLQTMEHFLSCHKNAFEFFGGVPKKIMVDNLKSAVIRRFIGQEPILNPKYLDFAKYYAFTITPCNVRKANEKGRVENGVGYVKKNFLSGLDIPDFESIHHACR
jgi:transposase